MRQTCLFTWSGQDQNKDETHLTDLEKTACKGLLKNNHLSWAAAGDTVDDDNEGGRSPPDTRIYIQHEKHF